MIVSVERTEPLGTAPNPHRYEKDAGDPTWEDSVM